MVTMTTKIFIQELVVGFGFLNGLWIYSGANPEAEIIKSFAALVPDSYSWIFWLFLVLSPIISLFVTYAIGGLLGIIAVVLAFVGGITIASSFGIWLLLAGIILGVLACSTQ